MRDYGTAAWDGGDPACDHNPQRPDGGDRADRTLPLGRGGMYRDVCEKCGATRIDRQLGLERTPEEYVCKMVELFRELRRALKDDGTLWLNLGDSYMSGGGASRHYGYSDPKHPKGRNGKHIEPHAFPHPTIKTKDLVGIPWRVAFALQADGWYLRSDIIWHKPNPMPESVRDRPTKAHEYIFLLTKSAKYYYDYKAILEPAAYDGRKDTRFKGAVKYANGFAPTGTNPQSMAKRGHERWSNKIVGRTETKMQGTGYGGDGKGLHGHSGYFDADGNLRTHVKDGIPARNKRSVWKISARPFRQAHFATFPEALIEPCILAGARVGDIVLDPFSGAGTTGVVAKKHGRSYIGFELNPDYLEMARERIDNTAAPLLSQTY